MFYYSFLTPGKDHFKSTVQGRRGSQERESISHKIRLDETHGFPLKNHSKFSKTALWPQNFLRLRRAKGGFALGNVPHAPESATLTVTIIPVTPAGGVKTPGTVGMGQGR